MHLDDFNYILPKELVAQSPADKTAQSKLLLSDNKKIIAFKSLVDNLTDKDILVFNDTKVMPVVIKGSLNNKEIKVTLLESLGSCKWKAFIKPAKKVNLGDVIEFRDGLNLRVNKKENAIADIKFSLNKKELLSYLDKYGNLPLPPYIKSQPNRSLDEKNYQTIFSKNYGAVASPTAGLHFKSDLLKDLKKRNINFVNITLHIGLGTFLPLNQEVIKKNILHREKGIISSAAAFKINKAINEGKNIVAVGTTVMRLLEACQKKYGKIKKFNEYTDIFIYPGFKFNVVDKLLTNFHLPKSSLLILVSAFAGKNKIFELYNFAIKNKMRFFSFGDAMLIKKK
jgi:S-adenosylmethionine:tRNA ribosyltransferase-isomerase